MKLYDGIGPNPRMVRMFLHEKGIALPSVQVDILGGENRRAPHTDRNPMGQLPALELDSGRCLTEITAICEYIEEKHPAPSLIGTSAEEKGETRMWTRRVDLNVCEPLANGFRYGEGLALFKDRIRCIPEASAGLKQVAQDNLAKVDAALAGKQFLCGERFTMADMLLYAFLDFAPGVGQPLDLAKRHLTAWYERVNARPSAEASLNPAAVNAGLRG
jgi:glutathione S-transferase